MKKIINIVSFAVISVVIASCTSSKDILYFQDISQTELQKLANEYEAVIKKDDRLTIVVSGPDKTVTAPYNLTLGEASSNGGYSTISTNPEQATLSYLVDKDGNINFPILGKVHVEGMTRNKLADYLTQQISKDVKNPVVYVSFRNYKVTILGEVRNPGTYTMDSEKVTILQALGRAGDLNLTALREVVLLREVNGQLTHTTIDLKNSDILSSPYYYLQQNDVLYIPPSATRVTAATTATGIWSVILSSITTMVAVLGIILK